MPRARISGFLIVMAALLVSAEAAVVHQKSREQLKKRLPFKRPPPPPPFVPSFNLEQQAYLMAHNTLRRQAGTPPLVWDANLTAQAYAWADQRRHDCNYRNHSTGDYGENIYWMKYKEFNPVDVVQWWYDEYKLYDPLKNACRCQPERDGCECGHYLNVIWSTTKRVGCSGAMYCDNQQGVYVVCQYYPAGLAQGINPFTGAILS